MVANETDRRIGRRAERPDGRTDKRGRLNRCPDGTRWS